MTDHSQTDETETPRKHPLAKILKRVRSDGLSTFSTRELDIACGVGADRVIIPKLEQALSLGVESIELDAPDVEGL